jgi:hypothetical protein
MSKKIKYYQHDNYSPIITKHDVIVGMIVMFISIVSIMFTMWFVEEKAQWIKKDTTVKYRLETPHEPDLQQQNLQHP